MVSNLALPVVLQRSNVIQARTLIGKVNDFTIVIGDTGHGPGCLVFCGFAGAKRSDGKYHGKYRFSLVPENEECGHYLRFDSLPGVGEVVEDTTVHVDKPITFIPTCDTDLIAEGPSNGCNGNN